MQVSPILFPVFPRISPGLREFQKIIAGMRKIWVRWGGGARTIGYELWRLAKKIV